MAECRMYVSISPFKKIGPVLFHTIIFSAMGEISTGKCWNWACFSSRSCWNWVIIPGDFDQLRWVIFSLKFVSFCSFYPHNSWNKVVHCIWVDFDTHIILFNCYQHRPFQHICSEVVQAYSCEITVLQDNQTFSLLYDVVHCFNINLIAS